MTDLLWLLVGVAIGLPTGVLGGYVYADSRCRHVPVLPCRLHSDEEHS